MAMFAKKSQHVEAIQLTPEVALECLLKAHAGPFGLQVTGSWHPGRGEVYRAHVTLYRGTNSYDPMRVAGLNDWIVKGENGELCAMSPETFAATYEPLPTSTDGASNG